MMSCFSLACYLCCLLLLLPPPPLHPSLLSVRFLSITLGCTSADLRVIGVGPLRSPIPCSLGMEETVSWGEAQDSQPVPQTR